MRCGPRCPFPVSQGMTVPEVLPLPTPMGQRGTQTQAFHQPAPSSFLDAEGLIFASALPQDPHIGISFFRLVLAPSCFSKSPVRLTLKMLVEQPEGVPKGGPAGRWALGAPLVFRHLFVGTWPSMPKPSPSQDQPWFLHKKRGRLSHERHHRALTHWGE